MSTVSLNELVKLKETATKTQNKLHEQYRKGGYSVFNEEYQKANKKYADALKKYEDALQEYAEVFKKLNIRFSAM